LEHSHPRLAVAGGEQLVDDVRFDALLLQLAAKHLGIALRRESGDG
jgi:hypothetical protein